MPHSTLDHLEVRGALAIALRPWRQYLPEKDRRVYWHKLIEVGADAVIKAMADPDPVATTEAAVAFGLLPRRPILHRIMRGIIRWPRQ